MVTVREGLRFVSRPLQDSEREIVLLALASSVESLGDLTAVAKTGIDPGLPSA